MHVLELVFACFGGMGLGWFCPLKWLFPLRYPTIQSLSDEMLAAVMAPERPRYPASSLPVVSQGQSVTVMFYRDGVEMSHRSVVAEDLHEMFTTSNGDVYHFSYVDHKGRFTYEMKA
jgi:hypothetical protein